MRASVIAIAAAVTAAVFVAPVSAQQPPKPAACVDLVGGFVAMLNRAGTSFADVQRGYDAIVQGCGPAADAPGRPSPPEPCRDAAVALRDAAQTGPTNTADFIRVRARFARACRPRCTDPAGCAAPASTPR